jgi:intraflagellar transport protein 80
VCVQAGLVFRAIKLNIKLFNFERALDLAQQYKQHQDTVLYYRQQYLRAGNQQESNPRFMQLSESVSVCLTSAAESQILLRPPCTWQA